MNVQIIFEEAVSNNADIIRKMINEDSLFATNANSNSILRALGSRIDRIETNEGTQKIYIKPLNNMLCG